MGAFFKAMTKPYYITTPLYYVNASPHIGHAYTNILCDTFARFRRFRGEKVFFLTGTDEHGTKIDRAARDQKQEPKAYVDQMVPKFKELWKLLEIEYDYFIRTTDQNHKETVQKILRNLEKKGEIYKASYTGWYCTPCESFWTKFQLAEGKCPDCHREVQALEEENYFFKLSQHQDWLKAYIQDNAGFIRPESRKNEILGFLEQPLEDLCITRPRNRLAWGIDYPTSKEHVVYVWFDALINYVSAVGLTKDAKKFKAHWPADAHVVGKDILRHHAVYWPIMLKACEVEMPKTIIAHGWWTMAGTKVSKSRGNAVDPVELVQTYGVDAFRYFLLREVTLGLDGAFSEDLLAQRYTTDLANDLGNLWFRLASMLGKYFEGRIPFFDLKSSVRSSPMAGALNLWTSVGAAMDDYNPRQALSEIWNLITGANQFIERTKPWELAKDAAKREDLASVLGHLAVTVAHVAVILQPLLPVTAAHILKRLKIAEKNVFKTQEDFIQPLVSFGVLVERGEALFPKLEEEKEEKI
ncbi:MAG: methionine--tRNA ligase [Candidatus Omnitrophica bacterium]|nr:methionine--tRNA ligase [Candidatus Omnitrophota bacterium]